MTTNPALQMVCCGVETLAQVLLRLRESRGMTQLALSAAAGVSVETIAKTEQGKGGKWHSANAWRILKALGHDRHLTQYDAAVFMQRTALSTSQVEGELTGEEYLSLVRLGIIADLAGDPLHPFVQRHATAPAEPADPHLSQLYALLDNLIVTVGAQRVLDLLRTADALTTGQQPPTPSEPRTLRVHEPPVQKEGYVSQTIRTVEVRDPKPAAAKPGQARRAKPK